MSLNVSREHVLRARLDFDRAEHRLVAQLEPWHARLGRHRLGLLIGGGLLGGVALATVPTKQWSRVGAMLFGSGASLMRSPIGLPLLGALWTALLKSSGDSAVGNSPAGPVGKP